MSMPIPVRAAAAALAATLLACALTSTGAAADTPHDARSAETERSVHVRAVSFQPTVAIGHGKRKVRFLTCKSGTEGNYTVHYKATTRKSSDRSAPRVKLTISDVGQEAGVEFSLFPGDLTEVSSSGLWRSTADVRVTLRLLGKVKKKQLTVGQMGAC